MSAISNPTSTNLASESAHVAVTATWSPTRVTRFALAGAGLFFVGVAAAGVMLPGVPTTGPLILASILLTKSCPALERKLLHNRFFGRYVRYLDARQGIPMRARVTAFICMWLSISISSVALYYSLVSPFWPLTMMILAGLAGSICIARFRRKLS